VIEERARSNRLHSSELQLTGSSLSIYTIVRFPLRMKWRVGVLSLKFMDMIPTSFRSTGRVRASAGIQENPKTGEKPRCNFFNRAHPKQVARRN
jgi:hypothetical protein